MVYKLTYCFIKQAILNIYPEGGFTSVEKTNFTKD